MTHDHASVVERMEVDLQAKDVMIAGMAPAPLQIKKRWVKIVGKKGGTIQCWPHVDKLVLEMLANRTKPICVQANILVCAKVIHPNWEVVKELSS